MPRLISIVSQYLSLISFNQGKNLSGLFGGCIFSRSIPRKKSNDPVQRAARIHSSWKEAINLRDELSPLRCNRSLARALPGKAPSASRLRPEVSLLPNVSPILICRIDTQPEPFLQHSGVRREPSPFITHLVVDYVASIWLREINRLSYLMSHHTECLSLVRGVPRSPPAYNAQRSF